MSVVVRVVVGLCVVAILVCTVGAVWWFTPNRPNDAKPVKPSPPVKVDRPANEADLNRLTLTPEAEKALGVTIGRVERKTLRLTRLYGGEVTVPAGRAILVSAPLGGLLRASAAGLPQPGTPIKKGQPVFELLPLLTPEARTTLAAAKVDADGQVKNARTQLDAATIAFERAQRLLREEAGSRRAVDETQAQFEIAQKTLEAAEARRDLLERTVGEVEKGTAAPIVVESPQDGMLRVISALPGQNVPGGAALFEVVDLARVWIRIPVYVGDLPNIAEGEPATIRGLGAKPREAGVSARPIAAPPSANPQAATVDLFFDAENPKGRFTPGQRIGAQLALKSEAESLTLPWSAVVYDINGGAWVYEQVAPRTFVRRRVTVRSVVGNIAILGAGLPLGTNVVGEGAQELFGSETGFSK